MPPIGCKVRKMLIEPEALAKVAEQNPGDEGIDNSSQEFTVL